MQLGCMRFLEYMGFVLAVFPLKYGFIIIQCYLSHSLINCYHQYHHYHSVDGTKDVHFYYGICDLCPSLSFSPSMYKR